MSEFGYYDENNVWHPADNELEQITVEIPKQVTDETNLHYNRPLSAKELEDMEAFDAARFPAPVVNDTLGKPLLIGLCIAVFVILLLIGFLIFVLPLIIQGVTH